MIKVLRDAFFVMALIVAGIVVAEAVTEAPVVMLKTVQK